MAIDTHHKFVSHITNKIPDWETKVFMKGALLVKDYYLWTKIYQAYKEKKELDIATDDTVYLHCTKMG